ncbi:hypothetical protein [Sanguibacter antarcticus]|uniref:Excreted virulence factor EspC (Type VII ESX diderm) n=1 Tax=Sanguibacter antarcticus TaxID=372484 RepID=A0A2A9E373_9MICO|nr:hypothetical protein [Sanguibacter antarcticus]PFG32805.1 hypothetical protein ATL42_0653 [Sanguibacter antarcticus]
MAAESDAVTVDEQLLAARIKAVSVLIEDIQTVYAPLHEIGARSTVQAWTAVPSCQTFARAYLTAVNATVDVLYQAEAKVSGLVESLRTFADEIQLADEDALRSLERLERQAQERLSLPGEQPLQPAVLVLGQPDVVNFFAPLGR